jgi:hypothetical protein
MHQDIKIPNLPSKRERADDAYKYFYLFLPPAQVSSEP